MSFGNFGELKSAITARFARSDKAALIPDYILITHRKMMRGHSWPNGLRLPALRIDAMLAWEDLAPSGGAATLPADFAEAKMIYPDDAQGVPLKWMPSPEFRSKRLARDGGTPEFYTIEGDQLLIAPANTTTLKLQYYAEITLPNLTGNTNDSQTNAILSKAPDAYLYGALAEAFAQTRSFDVAQYYEAQFIGSVTAANAEAKRTQETGTPLVMMPTIIV